MATVKQEIIIAHGHLCHFWSLGVYYTAEIAHKYSVILLVPEEYREDSKFQAVCKYLQISDIVYYEYCGINLLRHFNNCRMYKSLLLKHKPAFVVQHDYIGIENMYLFHWADKLLPACLKLVVLTSFPSNENTEKFNDQFAEMSAKNYSAILKIPLFVLVPVRKLAVYGFSMLRNKLLPMITLRQKPYFPLSQHNNIDIVPKKSLFDFYFFYDSCEKTYMDLLFADADKAQNNQHQIIRCPVIDQHNVNRFLHDVQEQNLLSITPSLIGLRPFKEEEPTLNKWVEALNILRDQLPNYEFIMRFHPANKSNRIKIVKAYIKQHCSFLKFHDNRIPAEALMLNSKVVVGDVSTTLWWANFRKTKVVISLGMQDFHGSKDMHYYSDIMYFENMSDLGELDLPALVEEQGKKRSQNTFPLLTDIMASI